MDRVQLLEYKVVWCFTYGPPSKSVMELFRSLTEAGSTSWVIVPIPPPKETKDS